MARSLHFHFVIAFAIIGTSCNSTNSKNEIDLATSVDELETTQYKQVLEDEDVAADESRILHENGSHYVVPKRTATATDSSGVKHSLLSAWVSHEDAARDHVRYTRYGHCDIYGNRDMRSVGILHTAQYEVFIELDDVVAIKRKPGNNAFDVRLQFMGKPHSISGRLSLSQILFGKTETGQIEIPFENLQELIFEKPPRLKSEAEKKFITERHLSDKTFATLTLNDGTEIPITKLRRHDVYTGDRPGFYIASETFHMDYPNFYINRGSATMEVRFDKVKTIEFGDEDSVTVTLTTGENYVGTLPTDNEYGSGVCFFGMNGFADVGSVFINRDNVNKIDFDHSQDEEHSEANNGNESEGESVVPKRTATITESSGVKHVIPEPTWHFSIVVASNNYTVHTSLDDVISMKRIDHQKETFEVKHRFMGKGDDHVITGIVNTAGSLVGETDCGRVKMGTNSLQEIMFNRPPHERFTDEKGYLSGTVALNDGSEFQFTNLTRYSRYFHNNDERGSHAADIFLSRGSATLRLAFDRIKTIEFGENDSATVELIDGVTETGALCKDALKFRSATSFYGNLALGRVALSPSRVKRIDFDHGDMTQTDDDTTINHN